MSGMTFYKIDIVYLILKKFKCINFAHWYAQYLCDLLILATRRTAHINSRPA